MENYTITETGQGTESEIKSILEGAAQSFSQNAEMGFGTIVQLNNIKLTISQLHTATA